MALQTLFKQSYEERIFQFDFSAFMATGATLSSVVSVVSDGAGLTISSAAVSGTLCQALFAGGSSGTTYKITAKVIDSDGQKLELDGNLRVQDE